MMKEKKGQVGTIVGVAIAIIVIAIVVVAVALPIMSSSVATGNYTGVTKTVMDNIVPITAVGVLLLIIGATYLGFGRK